MISVIITAGGSSSRFKGQNKLLYEVAGKTIIEATVEKFLLLEFVDEIILSANSSIIDILNKIFSKYSKVKIVLGGETRQQSVYNGLKTCSDCSYVIIHDGARPFITENVIKNCLNKAKNTAAAIVAVKTIDTIKIVDENMVIKSTPDRQFLWNAQTPQIFDYKLIADLHEKYKDKNFTDDSLLCEYANIPVSIVEGDYSNIKITTLKDVENISL